MTSVNRTDLTATLRSKFNNDWGSSSPFAPISLQFEEALLAVGNLLDLFDPTLLVHAEVRGHVYEGEGSAASDISIRIGEHR